MEKNVSFNEGEFRFNLRSAAVCQRGDEVMLFYFPDGDFWSLPGGRCVYGEDTETGIKREMFEEIGEQVSVERLLWVDENFFNLEGKRFHELLFIYLVKLPENSQRIKQDEFFAAEEKYDNKCKCKWVKLADLPDYKLMPFFLRSGLKKLPAQTEHLIKIDDNGPVA